MSDTLAELAAGDSGQAVVIDYSPFDAMTEAEILALPEPIEAESEVWPATVTSAAERLPHTDGSIRVVFKPGTGVKATVRLAREDVWRYVLAQRQESQWAETA